MVSQLLSPDTWVEGYVIRVYPDGDHGPFALVRVPHLDEEDQRVSFSLHPEVFEDYEEGVLPQQGTIVEVRNVLKRIKKKSLRELHPSLPYHNVALEARYLRPKILDMQPFEALCERPALSN